MSELDIKISKLLSEADVRNDKHLATLCIRALAGDRSDDCMDVVKMAESMAVPATR